MRIRMKLLFAHPSHRGDTEPAWSPSTKLTIYSSSLDDNLNMIVNGTCHDCRVSSMPINSSSPLIFAIGPGIDLSSDDPDARIRRHAGYGPHPPSSL
jgi:hypothetical protein